MFSSGEVSCLTNFNQTYRPQAEGVKPWMERITSPTDLRQYYRSMVFQPDFAQPTMLLSEYGDMELEKMREREARSRAVRTTLDFTQALFRLRPSRM